MRKLLIALFITAAAPLAYGQYAAPAPARDASAPAAATATDQNALTPKAGSEAAQVNKLLGERNCLRETGSNIVRKDKACVNAMGQAYGETAIERTGTYDTGVALERLSPAIQVRGH